MSIEPLAGRAPREQNRVPVLFAESSNQDGSIVPLEADPATGRLLVNATATITPSGTQDVNLKQVGGAAFSLGQQLAASSLPIVLTAAQLTTLTPLSSVSISNFPATQPVSGTVAVTQSTSPWVVSLASTTITGSVAVTGTFFQATQPISAVSLPLATGAATSSLQTTGNSSLASIDSKLSGTLTIAGSVGTTLNGVNVGQTTSNTSAVQLTASSIPAINGILVQAISTNIASVFIGGSGVATGTGFELQAGQAVPFTATNINLLYVIGSNSSDKVCWNVL